MDQVFASNSVTNVCGARTHSVSRSAEFLSCARTVVKIAKSRRQQQQVSETAITENDWSERLNPSDLELYDPIKCRIDTPLNNILEDALSLLHAMEIELTKLDSLVRRRGHSNDPTQEISVAVGAVESDAAELTAIVQEMDHKGSIGYRFHHQRQHHIKAIQEWFQIVAQHYTGRLRDVLAVRASVLTEQAQRRGMFQAANIGRLTKNTPSLTLSAIDNSYGCADVVTSEAQQALFAPLPPKLNPTSVSTNRYPSSDQQHAFLPGKNYSHMPLSTAENREYESSYYHSTSGKYSGLYDYGGNSRPTSTSYEEISTIEENSTILSINRGIRRRKQPATTVNSRSVLDKDDSMTDATLNHQVLTLERRQRDRQTAARLNEARQAEQSLAALGTVFGKMSILISQQSETLSKIEDDVEAATFDVNAGHEEITTLYAIKKGNRVLIIKVFCLLNFLIVFMKFYNRK